MKNVNFPKIQLTNDNFVLAKIKCIIIFMLIIHIILQKHKWIYSLCTEGLVIQCYKYLKCSEDTVSSASCHPSVSEIISKFPNLLCFTI